MKRSLYLRLRSAVFSPGMLASVMAGVILLMWFSVNTRLNMRRIIGPVPLFDTDEYFLNSIYNSHAMSGFDLFAPILAVLPASTLFCGDYNSGYVKEILLRTDRKRYMRETVICSTIAGGLGVFLPSLITSAVFIAGGRPMLQENLMPGEVTLLDGTPFAGMQFIWNGGLVVVILLVLAFLFGAVWSNIGLCISAFSPNRYVSLAAPFAVYYGLHLFCYRMGSLIVFSPVNTLMPMVDFLPGIGYLFIYQGILLTVSIVLFHEAAGRRLRDV